MAPKKKKRPATAAEVADATSSSSEKKLKTDASVEPSKEQARLKYEAELPTRSRAVAAAALPPRPDVKEVLEKVKEWRATDHSLPAEPEEEEGASASSEAGVPAGVFYIDNVIPKALTQSMDAQFQLIAAHPNPDYHPGLSPSISC